MYYQRQSNLSIKATLQTEESGRCGEVTVMGTWGGGGGYKTIFLGSTTCFFVLSSCLLCPLIMVIQSYIMYRDKIHKKLELCFESKY